jgi:hypothetical protein
LLRVVRLHHAFSKNITFRRKENAKRMNECSNNGDKIGCSRRPAEQVGKGLFNMHKQKHIVQTVYGGPFVLYSNNPQQVVAQANYYVPAQNQQLPIKDKGPRWQANTFGKWYSGYELVTPFLYNVPVPARPVYE